VKPRGTIFLMYHELEVADRSLCRSDAGYARYCVHVTEFERQLGWLRRSGLRGVSVSEALDPFDAPHVAITFDDGCETDFLHAAPALSQAGCTATFYVTTGFLGKPGFLSATQLRQLSDAGFEIGCHSSTHAYLPDLGIDELWGEIGEPKEVLQQLIGRQVDHFSCPGGRWSRRVADVARRAGYLTMATSRCHPNTGRTDRLQLGRIAVLRQTALIEFASICTGKGLWRLRWADELRSAAKRVLGNSSYDRVRALLMGREEPPQK
jgi:peptidoglycan/xylan/chitin deacetylase (PgdA/CDA1 family)